MSMSEFLATHYGEPQPQEHLEKAAQAELFAKLASDHGIDLNQLTEPQIQQLWNETFSKAASDGEGDEDEKLVEEAEKEHEEKKEAMAKIAEAEEIGRIMARAMHDELNELNKHASAGQYFSRAANFMKRQGQSAVADVKNIGRAHSKLRDAKDALPVAKQMQNSAHLTSRLGRRAEAYKSVRNAAAGRTAARVAGVGAVGAAGYGVTKALKKESSALDTLAAEVALEKAASAGWDIDEAVNLISTVVEMNPGDGVKVAAAQDLASAVDVRSLELLEAAGYPVEWA